VSAVLLRGNSTNVYISYQSIVRRFIIGLIIRYVSVDTIEKIIIPKPNIFAETRSQDSFQVCDCSSCYLLAETNKFCPGADILSCLVS
jgi:hypothetical protein